LRARHQKFRAQPLPVRASALSYTTLLALIPLLAVAISVTSSLLKNEGEEKIYQAIDKLVSNSSCRPQRSTPTTGGFAQSQPGPVGHIAADQFRNAETNLITAGSPAKPVWRNSRWSSARKRRRPAHP
jgi:uncharacterized BrkB/YihY/UPF0761 family membrane protein